MISSLYAAPLSLRPNIENILANKTRWAGGFDFIVTGDNQGRAKVYGQLLNRTKSFKPIFILNTGDFVRSDRQSEYDDYAQQIAALDIPILHVAGNHDVSSGSYAFHQYVGEPNWYFDVGDVRIIGLDNSDGKFSPEAVAFARRTITSQKRCLVAFHMPPPLGRWAVHAMTGDDNIGHGGQITQLIKEAKVPAVFLGHIHLYDKMDVDGTEYIIGGGGGASLDSKYHFGKPEHGFVLVQIRSNSIRHQWIPLD